MKANYANDGFKNTGISLIASVEEIVIITGALQDKLEKHIGFLEFYSDESHKEFFEKESINSSEEVERQKAKINKLQQILKEIGGN